MFDWCMDRSWLCMHRYVCVYIYIHMCMYVYIYIYSITYVYIYIYISVLFVSIYLSIYLYIYIQICTYTKGWSGKYHLTTTSLAPRAWLNWCLKDRKLLSLTWNFIATNTWYTYFKVWVISHWLCHSMYIRMCIRIYIYICVNTYTCIHVCIQYLCRQCMRKAPTGYSLIHQYQQSQ